MAFPVVSLIDSFIRAAEKPLNNGGIWSLMGGCTTKGEVASEAWKGTTAFAAEDGAFYNQEELSGEVGHALEMHIALSSERYLKLWCCMSNPDVALAKAGYYLKARGEVTAGKVNLRLERWAENAPTLLGEKAAVALASGDRIGISVQGGHVIAWKKAGAGAWEEILNVVDATYTQGFIGITSAGNAHAWRNLEAGGTAISARFLATTGQKQTAKLAHSISRSLNATQAQGAMLSKTHNQTATQGATAVLSKQATKLQKLIKQTQAAKLVRRPERTLSSSQEQSAHLTGGLTVSATQGQAVSLAHSLARTLPLLKAKQAATLRRTIELSTTQGSSATVTGTPLHRLTLTQASSATPARTPTKLKLLKQASSAKLRRALARTLVVASSTSTALGGGIEGARTLTVGQEQHVTLEALVLTDEERKIREEEEARREREREEREEREREEREPHTTIGAIVLSGTVMS